MNRVRTMQTFLMGMLVGELLMAIVYAVAGIRP